MGCGSSTDNSTSIEKDPTGMRDVDVAEEKAYDIVDKSNQALPHLQIRFAAASQRGCYPEAFKRKAQDAMLLRPCFLGCAELHLFGVFDGHGPGGDRCAAFVRDKIEEFLTDELKDLGLKKLTSMPEISLLNAIQGAYKRADDAVTKHPQLEVDYCGSTALIALIVGARLVVANTGDSRAVWGRRKTPKNEAQPLTFDHNPYRLDEAQRIESNGGLIRTYAQKDRMMEDDDKTRPTLDIMKECDDSGDPPRVWDKTLIRPGCAFTRVIGDVYAKTIGVIAEPEFTCRTLDRTEGFFCLTTDGVSDFYHGEALVDMVAKHVESPALACKAVVDGVYKNWANHGVKTDDTTIVVVCVGPPEAETGKKKGRKTAKGA